MYDDKMVYIHSGLSHLHNECNVCTNVVEYIPHYACTQVCIYVVE